MTREQNIKSISSMWKSPSGKEIAEKMRDHFKTYVTQEEKQTAPQNFLSIFDGTLFTQSLKQ